MLWSYYRWCEKGNETAQVIFRIINNAFFVVPVVLLFIFAGRLDSYFLRTVAVIGGVLWFLISSTSKIYFNCKMRHLPPAQWNKWNRCGTEDFLVRWGLTLGLTVVAGIPLWLYLLTKLMFGPSNFVENAILLGMFLYVGGFLQFIIICFWIYMLSHVWTD